MQNCTVQQSASEGYIIAIITVTLILISFLLLFPLVIIMTCDSYYHDYYSTYFVGLCSKRIAWKSMVITGAIDEEIQQQTGAKGHQRQR